MRATRPMSPTCDGRAVTVSSYQPAGGTRRSWCGHTARTGRVTEGTVMTVIQTQRRKEVGVIGIIFVGCLRGKTFEDSHAEQFLPNFFFFQSIFNPNMDWKIFVVNKIWESLYIYGNVFDDF